MPLTALALLFALQAPATPLSLSEALTRARAHNPDVLAAVADVEAARGTMTQAGVLAPNPVLSGEGASHTSPGQQDVDYGISLGQELEIGGQRGLRMSAAQHNLARAEFALADRRRLVDADVRRSFAELASATRRRALAGERLALTRRTAETTRRRAGAGDVSDLAVKLANLETLRAEQALANAETEQARLTNVVAGLIGAEPDEVIEVADADTLPPPPTSEGALVARALAVRPDLAAAREARARLEDEARLAGRTGVVPNPSLRGFYRREHGNEQIAGAELSIPLPVWNREQGAELSARALAGGAAAEEERLRRDIPRQVRVALLHWQRAAATLSRYEQGALPTAKETGELVARAYDSGYLALPEMLVQQDRLLQVRSEAIDAWLAVRQAQSELVEAVGEEPK